jgi:hypothetical protein
MTASAHSFIFALAIGAAVISLWIVVRFPRLGPATVKGSCVQVVAAYLVGSVLPAYLIGCFSRLPYPFSLGLAVVVGALAPTIYLFLAIAWLIRGLQGLLSTAR